MYSTSLHGLRGSAVERPDTDDAYRKCESELDDEKRIPLFYNISMLIDFAGSSKPTSTKGAD